MFRSALMSRNGSDTKGREAVAPCVRVTFGMVPLPAEPKAGTLNSLKLCVNDARFVPFLDAVDEMELMVIGRKSGF